jgi:YNFM family putative membrane transporter
LRAEHARAQASTLYMLAYYIGSSVAGVLGGSFWVMAGWPGVVVLIGCMSTAALLLSFALAKMPPPAWLRQS